MDPGKQGPPPGYGADSGAQYGDMGMTNTQQYPQQYSQQFPPQNPQQFPQQNPQQFPQQYSQQYQQYPDQYQQQPQQYQQYPQQYQQYQRDPSPNSGSCINSFLWFLILVFFSYGIASVCAYFYVGLIPFRACFGAVQPVLDILLKGVNIPLVCSRKMMDGSKVC